ncbi:aminoglycoside phosphotransferase family protein [Arthrobacter sp. zg-Y820]|uniref:phosphotransferase family protein n=2 Tax=Arthrobacter TaxID=1663 RepID=UPI001E35F2B8|nr:MULTISPECIES: aminoglycoside phosphotransferase family protein [unclassified Arthrobacter]MCC9195867.1 aminoglycoside phosphotransferase family protein [Arthrobacter sp. zg-Y820]MDK1278727.1 aminoglycoside phosphotransferase family protein [Arthrobacter sp. zg.Y820]
MNRGSRTGARGDREAASKALLEGSDMSGPLAAALRPLGLKPVAWAHVRSHHRPGAGISALYRVEAVPRSAAAGHRPLHLQVGATTDLNAADGGATARGTVGGTAVRLWVHPRDPVLLGLPWATSAEAVARDVFGTDTDAARAALNLVAYRPLRRAVVRATLERPDGSAGPTVYLKVPQPHLAAGLRRRLQLAAAAGLPVPPLLDTVAGADTVSGAGPAAGVLILGGLPGRTLHRELSAAGTPALDPEALARLLDRLPAAGLALPRRPAWSERIMDYAAGAAVALPDGAERITRCARAIAAGVRSADPGPVVPTHGDFHGGNLLAGMGNGALRITGMLDVDALGPGHRVDDLACFLGHLWVLAALSPENTGLQDAAGRCARVFARQTDASALYCRSAAVALTLVAGAAARGSGAARRTVAAAEELLNRSRGRF